VDIFAYNLSSIAVGCPVCFRSCLAPNLKSTSLFFYQFCHILIPPPCCSVSCQTLCSTTYIFSRLQQAIFQAHPDILQVLGIPIRFVGLHLLHKTSLYIRFLQTPYICLLTNSFLFFLIFAPMCATLTNSLCCGTQASPGITFTSFSFARSLSLTRI